MLLSLGRRKILRLYKADAININVIKPSRQPCRKPTRYNIPHINMFLSLGRRKILRLYKADAININVIKPSRDAKSCVSQATVQQTDALQYITY